MTTTLRTHAFWTMAGIFLSILAALPASATAQSLDATVGIIAQAAASPAMRLEIDPSSEVRFLSIYFSGTESPVGVHYEYYGDGRVEINLYDSSRATSPSKKWISQLNALEIETLFAELVPTRLYALDLDEVRARDARRGVKRKPYLDVGTVLVEVSFVQLRQNGESAGVLSRRFVVDGGVLVPQETPDIGEYEALKRLVQFGQEVQARAAEVEQ